MALSLVNTSDSIARPNTKPRFTDTAVSMADDPNRPAHFPELISWPGLALVCWVFTALVGTLGITGLFGGPKAYSGMGTGLVPIAHSEAVLFIILGLSLVLFVYGVTRKFARSAVVTATLLCSVFSILKLVEHFGHAWFGIENLFNLRITYFKNFLVGAMSPVSAALFIAISVSVILLVIVEDQRKTAIRWAMRLTSACAIATVLIVLSYCFGNPLLYAGKITPVSLTAGIAFLFLEAGIFIAIGPTQYPIQFSIRK